MRVDPQVLGGSPYVADSRVPVRRLWAFYRGGISIERLLKRFPQLGPAKIFDALAFALDNPEVIDADVLEEQKLLQRSKHKTKAAPPEQIPLPFLTSDASIARDAGNEGAPTRPRKNKG